MRNNACRIDRQSSRRDDQVQVSSQIAEAEENHACSDPEGKPDPRRLHDYERSRLLQEDPVLLYLYRARLRHVREVSIRDPDGVLALCELPRLYQVIDYIAFLSQVVSAEE